MRIAAVRVFVVNLADARRFYTETLGLRIVWEYKNGAIGFDAGPATLIVEKAEQSADPKHRESVGKFTGISLQVDDIDLVYSELAAKGVRFLAPPEKMDWGGTLAHFKDSSGNVLTLLSLPKS